MRKRLTSAAGFATATGLPEDKSPADKPDGRPRTAQRLGLGIDDKHIVTVDADGVALAAIEGLYELVKQQQAEIERLKSETATLR
jgi:hypothetical protein